MKWIGQALLISGALLALDHRNWVVPVTLGVVILVWLNLAGRARSKALDERSHEVTFQDGVIHHHRPDGVRESVALSSLRAVIVETNDLGPYVADVFWILVGEGTKGCRIPQGATGDSELLKLLQTLPGFDSGKFLEAMSSTLCQKFTVWEKDSDGSESG